MEDYQQLQVALDRNDINCNVSELHGFLTAIICTIENPEQVPWSNMLQHEFNIALTDNLIDIFATRYFHDLEKIVGFNFDFELVIPDAGDDLKLKFKALIAWVRGFLAAISITGANNLDNNKMIQEILKDFIAISNTDEKSITTADSAGSEQDLMQLIEYCKVAVQNLRLELFPAADIEPMVH